MTGMLEGKAAVITGGGTGLGAAIARLFAGEGARVVVTGRRLAPLEEVARAVGGLAVAADVADEADVAALMAACDAAFGRLDVLVNNAGLSGPIAAAEVMDIAEWDARFAVNTRGVMLCIKHALPHMKRAGAGAIVNVSSRMALYPKANRSAYAASKAAMHAITESVAQEVGRDGIRVNTLVPGAMPTPMTDGLIAERARTEGRSAEEIIDESYIQPAVLKRWVEVDECARAALYLASDAASAVTGTHLVVDAGRA
ncbi:MAG TPA: SDR family oxidoreductase [Rhodospirillales bacterium]|nr:SDR family oxidoreductase [Rhodospirillales bacterium]